jgi:ribulose-phosphate 3-epimerase
MNHLIAPSILTANLLNLNDEIEMINSSQADWLHLDIMDGVFVPNISFGFPVIEQIAAISKKPLDVHLMITDPARYIERFKDCGANRLGIHIEADIHLNRTVSLIKNLGMKACVVINPHTSIFLLDDMLPEIDQVLVMSVNPGFGGQKFIENSYEKISRLKDLILKKSCEALIEVDGGVNLENAPRLVAAGADILVVGNAIFASENPLQTIANLKSF